MRDDLHWLPVQGRIRFKILLTTWMCISGSAPALSPGTLLSPLHNTGTSSASIVGDKSLPARRTPGQDSYNAKEGFRPRGADIMEYNSTRGTPLQGDELHFGYCQKTSQIIPLRSFRVIHCFFFVFGKFLVLADRTERNNYCVAEISV